MSFFGAIAPVLLLLGYLAVAGGMYLLRARRGHAFHDEEMDHRGQGGLTTPGLRHFFAWTVRPLWQGLARAGFPPDVITTLSIAFGIGAGIGVAAGHFALGGWLYLGAGLLDFLDGRVARETGRVTAGGAALDSVLDRYVEAALLCGLCWYYRGEWVLVLGLLALTGSLLVPYVRARGEALGAMLKDVGFMQRPERVVVLGAGTALSPLVEAVLAPRAGHPPQRLAVVALVTVAIAAQATALQRLLALRRTLAADEEPASVARPMKSALANLAATFVDFALAFGLVRACDAPPGLATALACLAGGAVSFALSRSWAFEATAGVVHAQLARYVVASFCTAFLNAGGVLLLGLLGAPFVLAWTVARAVVFATWSYPVQRDFVFAGELVAARQHRSGE